MTGILDLAVELMSTQMLLGEDPPFPGKNDAEVGPVLVTVRRGAGKRSHPENEAPAYESTSELSKTTLSTAFHSILVFCIFLGER